MLVMRTGDGIARYFMMAYTELGEIHEKREGTNLQVRNILIGLLKVASQIAAVAG